MNFSFWRELIDESYKIRIVDIGASDGGYSPSYQPLIDVGLASLIGFEPDKEACEVLNKKNQKNSVYYPYFVGDGEAATFYETNWVLTGSLYPPNTPLLEKFQNLSEVVTLKEEHPVQTHRLDDIAEINGADFLKMDIQGSELKVLENATNLLETTLVLQVEVEFVELYKGQPLFADVDSFLRSRGFQFHCFDGGLAGRTFKPLVVNDNMNKRINQVLWADAFYVRDWMNLGVLSKEQLITYAILSLDILKSPDLTHLILSQFDRSHNTNVAQKFLNILTADKKK